MNPKQFLFDQVGRFIDPSSIDGWITKSIYPLSKDPGKLSRIVQGAMLAVEGGRIEVCSKIAPAGGWPPGVRVLQGVAQHEALSGWLSNLPDAPFIILEFGKAATPDENIVFNYERDMVVISAPVRRIVPVRLIHEMDATGIPRREVFEFVRAEDELMGAAHTKRQAALRAGIEKARSQHPEMLRASHIFRQIQAIGPSNVAPAMRNFKEPSK